MDVARSCSVVPFTFFNPPPLLQAGQLAVPPPNAFGMAGPPPPVTRVRWYFCPPEAKVFPEPHCWGSTDFLDDYERAETKVGEDPYQSQYDLGACPPGIKGDHFCGSLADFQKPKDFDPAADSLDMGVNGVPTCCAPILNNLYVLTLVAGTVPCQVCPLGGISLHLTVRWGNFVQAPLMDGITYTVTYDPTAVVPSPFPGTPGGWVGSYVNPYTGFTVNVVWYLTSFGLECFIPPGPGQDYAEPGNAFPIDCGPPVHQDGFIGTMALVSGQLGQLAYTIDGV